MLYGMSFIYGIYGTLNLYGIRGGMDLSPMQEKAVLASLILMLVGLGFKIAMVPFHAWTPDVYEGAPTPVTAFISVAPKVAGFILVFRIFQVAFPPYEFDLRTLLAFLAAVTMTVGNLSALHQLNVKRLLAFSTISHVGYMLMGFAAGTPFGFQAVLVYLGAYAIMNIGAFAVVVQVSNRYGSDTLADFAGLSKQSLGTALGLSFILLSLAGIPPTVGFVGKWFVFSAAISSGLWWLAVVGALNAVVALYYYFRIVHQMFFVEPLRAEDVTPNPALRFALTFTLLATLGLGAFPQALFSATEAAARIFGTL
jgi:NADH-quinone oxidoreductase subunit N